MTSLIPRFTVHKITVEVKKVIKLAKPITFQSYIDCGWNADIWSPVYFLGSHTWSSVKEERMFCANPDGDGECGGGGNGGDSRGDWY